MESSILYGLIGGAGVAIAAVVGFVFVMPQLTAQSQTQTEQTQQQPQQQQEIGQDGRVIPPESSNPNDPGYLVGAQDTELQQEDPAYGNFLQTMNNQCSYIPGLSYNVGQHLPPSACQQSMQSAQNNWCIQNYDEQKCKTVNGFIQAWSISSSIG